MIIHIVYLSAKNRLNKLSLQAKTVAFELVTAHKVVSTEVEPRPSIHDVCDDLCEAPSLITIKYMMVGFQVTV